MSLCSCICAVGPMSSLREGSLRTKEKRDGAEGKHKKTKMQEMDVERHIEVFSAGCPLCLEMIETITLGKCGKCKVEVHDVHDPAVRQEMMELGIRAVPTAVIDRKVKVEGLPTFNWVCDKQLWTRLEKEYPLHNPGQRQR